MRGEQCRTANATEEKIRLRRERGNGVGIENDAAEAGYADPAAWELAWADEFNTPAGTAPNPDI